MKEYLPVNNSVSSQNRFGMWIPATPEPYHHLFQKECTSCYERFWTDKGYREHFGLRHILSL